MIIQSNLLFIVRTVFDDNLITTDRGRRKNRRLKQPGSSTNKSKSDC